MTVEQITSSVVKPLSMAVILVTSTMAYGQTPSVQIEPSLQSRISFTDNAQRRGSGGDVDLIGEVSPAISISRQGGRVRGGLNARFRNVYYVDRSDRSNSFLTLNGRGEVEAVEDTFFVEADAAVRRDGQTLFGGPAGDDFFGGTRRDETRTFSIAPRLEFALGNFAEGSLAYRARWLDGGGGTTQPQRLGQWTGTLANPTAFGRIGWGLNATRINSYYDDSNIDDVTRDIGRLTLFYNVSPQFRLRGIVGYESYDFGPDRRDSGNITGGGFDWFPTPRTTISATAEDRVFGDGFDLSFNHRRPRSVWALSYSRDLSSSLERAEDLIGIVAPGDPNLIFPVPEGTSTEDLAGLIDDGWNPLFVPTITDAYYIDDRWRASLTLVGARNRLNFAIFSSDRERVSGGGGDFAGSDRIRSVSGAVSLEHQLSALSSLNASIVRTDSKSWRGLERGREQWRTTIGYVHELSPNTTAGLTYRHVRVDGSGGVTDYVENIISATLNIRF